VDTRKSLSSALLLSAVLVGGLFLVGCDDNVEVIRDPAIHINKGMTWAWRPADMPEETKRGADGRAIVSRDVIKPQPPPPAQRLESNRDWNTEANRTQLQQAIERALDKKGLAQAVDPNVADILVDYHVAVKTRTATVANSYGGYPYGCYGYGCWTSYGGWGGWGWGPPEVWYQNVRFHEGTFVLDLALRNPRKLAYRAISRKELNNKPNISPYQAEQAVNHLLKDLKPK
jgi:hypothetical protein